MNHWPFIIAAYVLSIGGTVGLTLWSLAIMRKAEKRAESVTRNRAERS